MFTLSPAQAKGSWQSPRLLVIQHLMVPTLAELFLAAGYANTMMTTSSSESLSESFLVPFGFAEIFWHQLAPQHL